MIDREKLAASRFKCTVRERVLFEAGIKLGTVYHQFIGTPVNLKDIEVIESAMEKSIGTQPYVESVKIRIDRDVFSKSKDEYSYFSLSGEKIDVVVKIKIENVTATAEMRYDPELGYPLMYVSEIIED